MNRFGDLMVCICNNPNCNSNDKDEEFIRNTNKNYGGE